MNDPVADRVGDRGVADEVEQLGDRDLGGDDRGVCARTVFDDLEEGEPILRVEGSEPEIIEDKQRYAGDASDEASVTAVGALLLEELEELPTVEVESPVAENAGLRTRRA